MRILIVIGAGASYDCWPSIIGKPPDFAVHRLPLAKNLFSVLPKQNQYLQHYQLMGLASVLRTKSRTFKEKFDVEKELSAIQSLSQERNDKNTFKGLFKARFYLHSLISELTRWTLEKTSGHTVYVDLIAQLKSWIEESPQDRFVDLVVFNYDDLIENAMQHVYSYDWGKGSGMTNLQAYYSGKNLKIYKPHGSINWGREIMKNDNFFSYYEVSQPFSEFDQIELANSFVNINPTLILNNIISKKVVPAIAVPFKGKTDFNECPQDMQAKMLEATQQADKVITLGWKGGDEHFTKLLKSNNKIDEAYVVSPNGNTMLDSVFQPEVVKPMASTFSYFVSESNALTTILNSFLPRAS